MTINPFIEAFWLQGNATGRLFFVVLVVACDYIMARVLS